MKIPNISLLPALAVLASSGLVAQAALAGYCSEDLSFTCKGPTISGNNITTHENCDGATVGPKYDQHHGTLWSSYRSCQVRDGLYILADCNERFNRSHPCTISVLNRSHSWPSNYKQVCALCGDQNFSRIKVKIKD